MGGVDNPRCPCCGTRLVVCPACLAVFAASAGRGRPRRWCSDRCRWRAGHAAARERARQERRAGLGDLPGLGGLPGLDELAGSLAALAWPG